MASRFVLDRLKELADEPRSVPRGEAHLICGISSPRYTSAIRKWLAAYPRFHVHFTHAGNPWLNQFE
ncbi:hypothetical protein [Streptomyces sp. NPDC055709]